jgi:ribosomal protein L44E
MRFLCSKCNKSHFKRHPRRVKRVELV